MKLTTHMVMVNRITYSSEEAVEIAREHGVDCSSILDDVSFCFIHLPMGDFKPKSIVRILGDGYMVIKGEEKTFADRNKEHYKSYRAQSIEQNEREKEEIVGAK
jgi:hypothetical protein